MKMKLNIKAILLFLLVAGAFSSCSDVLNTAPDGSLTMDEILSDADKVGGLLNACYDNVPLKGYTYFQFEPLLTATSDEGWTSDEGVGLAAGQVYSGIGNATTHPIRDFVRGGTDGGNGNYWARFWSQIFLCN